MTTIKSILGLFVLFVLFKTLGAIPTLIISIIAVFVGIWIEKKIAKHKNKKNVQGN